MIPDTLKKFWLDLLQLLHLNIELCLNNQLDLDALSLRPHFQTRPPNLKDNTYTHWLFNIAMENHHF